MKHLVMIAAMLSAPAFAAEVGVVRNEYGSGTPGTGGFERAVPVERNGEILHAPQYMPMYPTAGMIWPRVVEVPCTKTGDVLKCQGYTWTPKLGRGEYLFIKPVMVEPAVAQPPQVTTIIKEVPVIVLKEVPVKLKKE